MFLPDTDPDSLSLQMDDLFQKFHTITTDDPELRFATLSAGLCLCSTDDSFEDCYSKADKALYYVKQNGKNQFFSTSRSTAALLRHPVPERIWRLWQSPFRKAASM